MMGRFKQECKLCDNIISDQQFKTIDDVMKNVFDILLLNLTLDNEIQNVSCTVCYSKLLAASNFKSTCLNTDNSITTYIDLNNPKLADLTEIYGKVKGGNRGGTLSDDGEVCRLCLHLTNSDHKSIQEVPVDSFQTYIPEINFAVTTNPVICTKCYDALCIHSSFVKNCLEVEKNRSMVVMDVEDILLNNPTIKTEEIEIKPELVDEETLYEILCDIKKEGEEEEGDTSLHSQNGSVDAEETQSFDDLKPTSAESHSANCESKEYVHKTGSKTRSASNESQHKTDSSEGKQLTRKYASEVQKYKCDECNFETKYRKCLRQHRILHKNPSEVQRYSCDACDYKSLQKGNLLRHQLTHNDPLVAQKYMCDECDYKSIRKADLKIHRLKHKNALEVQMYKCEECDFKTRYRNNLGQHQLRHKDPSEVQKYMCDQCDYKSTQKDQLRRHQLVHKDPSEVKMYKCDACEFETKYSKNLTQHSLSHKNPSKVETYKCDGCQFETKYKRYLKKHQFVHRDASEEPVYQCDDCDYKSIVKRNFFRHRFVHRDPLEMPKYECEECDYKSTQKRNLKKHQLRHTRAFVETQKLETDRN